MVDDGVVDLKEAGELVAVRNGHDAEVGGLDGITTGIIDSNARIVAVDVGSGIVANKMVAKHSHSRSLADVRYVTIELEETIIGRIVGNLSIGNNQFDGVERKRWREIEIADEETVGIVGIIVYHDVACLGWDRERLRSPALRFVDTEVAK